MNDTGYHECNLNVRHDLPIDILEKVVLVYKRMPGWLGFGKDGTEKEGIPCWFSYNEDEKYVLGSIEPSGLHFEANMDKGEWMDWKSQFKKIATEVLGFKVGEIEEGEVGNEIEWIKK